MKLFFYLYLVLPKKSGFNLDLTNNLISDNNYKLGYDFTKNEYNEEESIYKINENFKNKKLLTILESNQISLEDKLKLIDDYDILEKKYIDIKAGGLLDDFNFDF